MRRCRSMVLLAVLTVLGIPTVTLGQAPDSAAAVYWFRPQSGPTIIASMRRLPLEQGFGSQCEPVLVAEFAFGTEGPRGAQVVKLGIISGQFDGQPLRVEADGAWFALGTLRRLEFVEYTWCRYMPATVGVEVERMRFVTIAGSERIVLHIGERAIALEGEHVRALRALATELESTTQRPVLTRPPN